MILNKNDWPYVSYVWRYDVWQKLWLRYSSETYLTGSSKAVDPNLSVWAQWMYMKYKKSFIVEQDKAQLQGFLENVCCGVDHKSKEYFVSKFVDEIEP